MNDYRAVPHDSPPFSGRACDVLAQAEELAREFLDSVDVYDVTDNGRHLGMFQPDPSGALSAAGTPMVLWVTAPHLSSRP